MEREKAMENKPKMWDFKNISRLFKGGKAKNILLAVGFLAIGLILLSELWPKPTVSAAKTGISAEEYAAKMEQRLQEIVQGIEGAGECRVMVTLENGVEYVYATQQKVNTNRVEKNDGDNTNLSLQDGTEDSIIIVDTDAGKQGLLITEIQPTVKGVVVVCSGGDNPLVQERVTKAVTTVLNIASGRVCVTKAS